MHSASAVYALSAMAQTAVALGYGSSCGEESAILPPVVCALQWYLQADAWDPAFAAANVHALSVLSGIAPVMVLALTRSKRKVCVVLVAAAVLVAVVAASQNGRELQTPPVCVACLLWVTTLPMAFSYDVVDSHHTHAQAVQRAWTTLSALGRRVIEVDDDDCVVRLSRSLRRPLKGPLTAAWFSRMMSPRTRSRSQGGPGTTCSEWPFSPRSCFGGSPLPLCSHARFPPWPWGLYLWWRESACWPSPGRHL